MIETHIRTRRGPAAMAVARKSIDEARKERRRQIVAQGHHHETVRRRDKEAWEREIVERMEGERLWLASRQTGLPSGPCFKCGAARWCSHRGPDSF